MSSRGDQLAKRARMVRHAHRALPNILKARFHPTAIWTTETNTALSTPTTTSDDNIDLIPITTPTRTTSSSVSSVMLSTSSTPATPATAEVTTSATSASLVVTSSGSTRVSAIPTTSSTTTRTSSTTSSILSTASSVLPTTTVPSSTRTTSSQIPAQTTRVISTHTSSVTSLAASATSTGTTSSGITTTGIIGIAAASVVGAAVVAGLVMFFVRRWNRKQNEFDPDDFRRQSVVLRDDNSSLYRGNSSGRGGSGPRPPTMFERHHQNIATFTNVTPSNMYQASGASYGSANPFNDPASHYSPSGMYIPGSAASPAPPAQYANASPFYNPPMQSPVGSPVTVASYGGATYDAQGRLVRLSSNAASMLSRNNSVAHPPYLPEETDYADLTRSSVTPFQAAQYEAISRQLNIPPPMPLQQVSEADEAEDPKFKNEENESAVKNIDSALIASPFEDPRASAAQGSPNPAFDDVVAKLHPARASSEIHSAEAIPRVTSQPPSLPEIKMLSGTFSPVTSSFPVTPSARKGSFDLHSGRASPKVDLPPLSPMSNSPQRAQFVDGLEARAHDGHETPVEIVYVVKDTSPATTDAQAPAGAKTKRLKNEAPKPDAPKRPETIYSDDDAYGGI